FLPLNQHKVSGRMGSYPWFLNKINSRTIQMVCVLSKDHHIWRKTFRPFLTTISTTSSISFSAVLKLTIHARRQYLPSMTAFDKKTSPLRCRSFNKSSLSLFRSASACPDGTYLKVT